MSVELWDKVFNNTLTKLNSGTNYSTSPNLDSNIEASGLSGTKIDTIRWDQGFGGTLTLGGIDNISGMLVLDDANYIRMLQLDIFGVHLFDTAQHELIKLDNIGLHAYDVNHNQLLQVDEFGFHAYDLGGNPQMEIVQGSVYVYGSQNLIFSQSVSPLHFQGIIGVDSFGEFIVASDFNNVLSIIGASVLNLAALNGDVNANFDPSKGLFDINGNSFSINANTAIVDTTGGVGIVCGTHSKLAIVPTKDGYRAVHAMESPDVWFMDFTDRDRVIDPLFLEVTEPPYHYINCADGCLQVWGRRKGFANKRFEKKTEEEAIANEKYLMMALPQK